MAAVPSPSGRRRPRPRRSERMSRPRPPSRPPPTATTIPVDAHDTSPHLRRTLRPPRPSTVDQTDARLRTADRRDRASCRSGGAARAGDGVAQGPPRSRQRTIRRRRRPHSGCRAAAPPPRNLSGRRARGGAASSSKAPHSSSARLRATGRDRYARRWRGADGFRDARRRDAPAEPESPHEAAAFRRPPLRPQSRLRPPNPEQRAVETISGYYAMLPGDLDSAWPR